MAEAMAEPAEAPNEAPRPVNSISFSGCGFNSPYLVGSCAAFMRYAPHILNDENLHILGASAGAMLGACMLCHVNLQECVNFICELADDYKEGWWGPLGMLPPPLSVYRKIRRALHTRLPANAHSICSNRLHVSVTNLALKNEMLTEFSSKDELIDALICSGFIPLLAGYAPQLPKYRKKAYVDGGLSNNSPRLDERTIVVTPFCGENDICPRDDEFSVFGSTRCFGTHFCLNLSNIQRIAKIVMPPDAEGIMRMLDTGFRDTVDFLALHDLISCPDHIAFHMTSDHCVEVGGDFDSEGEEVEFEVDGGEHSQGLEDSEERLQEERRRRQLRRTRGHAANRTCNKRYGPRCRRCHEIQTAALQSSIPTSIRDRILNKPEEGPSLAYQLFKTAMLPITVPYRVVKKGTNLATNLATLPVRTSFKMMQTGVSLSSWLLNMVSTSLDGQSSARDGSNCLSGVQSCLTQLVLQPVACRLEQVMSAIASGLHDRVDLTCQFDFTRNFEGELFPELSRDLEEAARRSPTYSQSSSAPQTTRVGIRVSFTYDRSPGSCTSINSLGSSSSSSRISSCKGPNSTEKPLHMLAGSLQPDKVEVTKVSPRGEVVYRPSSTADMTSPAMAPCQDVLDQLGECLDMALSDEDSILSCSAEDDQRGTAYKVLHVEDGKLRSPSRTSRLYQSNPGDLAWDDDDLNVAHNEDDFDLGSMLDMDFADLGGRRTVSTPNISTVGPAGDPLGTSLEMQSNSMFNLPARSRTTAWHLEEDGGSSRGQQAAPDSGMV